MHDAGSTTTGRVVVVTGPTAAGKTPLAIEIASRFDGEIINADSMQVFQYMDIGTAKCRAITAPGLASEKPVIDVPLGAKGSKALDDDDPETSTARNRAKRAKKKANKAANAAKADAGC